jgi:hypothetical protein
MIGINLICAITLGGRFRDNLFRSVRAIASSLDGNWSVVAQTTHGHYGSMQFALSINRGRLYSDSG